MPAPDFFGDTMTVYYEPNIDTFEEHDFLIDFTFLDGELLDRITKDGKEYELHLEAWKKDPQSKWFEIIIHVTDEYANHYYGYWSARSKEDDVGEALRIAKKNLHASRLYPPIWWVHEYLDVKDGASLKPTKQPKNEPITKVIKKQRDKKDLVTLMEQIWRKKRGI